MESLINAESMNPTEKEGFRCGINGQKWCWVTSSYGADSNNQHWHLSGTHLRENGPKEINGKESIKADDTIGIFG